MAPIHRQRRDQPTVRPEVHTQTKDQAQEQCDACGFVAVMVFVRYAMMPRTAFPGTAKRSHAPWCSGRVS